MSPAPPSSHRETVFIVDDDASVRDSLSLMLSLKGHTTATFASAEDFLQAWQPAWRGCVIVDIRLGGMSGLELQEIIRSRAACLPVIVITAHGDVAAARQAFLSHAVDFIEKPFEGQQIVEAIEHARERVAIGIGASSQADSRSVPKAALSEREQQVMSLLVHGLDNRAIASELGISHRTVEIHKARVLEKTGVRNVLELVRLAGQRPE
jgi:FixJ family two-component response regulator